MRTNLVYDYISISGGSPYVNTGLTETVNSSTMIWTTIREGIKDLTLTYNNLGGKNLRIGWKKFETSDNAPKMVISVDGTEIVTYNSSADKQTRYNKFIDFTAPAGELQITFDREGATRLRTQEPIYLEGIYIYDLAEENTPEKSTGIELHKIEKEYLPSQMGSLFNKTHFYFGYDSNTKTVLPYITSTTGKVLPLTDSRVWIGTDEQFQTVKSTLADDTLVVIV